jgi:two-component system LytT family sensor kinase
VNNLDPRAERYRYFFLTAVVWVVLVMAFAVPEYLLGRYIGHPLTWGRAVMGAAPHYVLWSFLAVFIVRLAQWKPIERQALWRRLGLHLLLSITFYAIDGAISLATLPAIIGDPQLTPFVMRRLAIRGFYDDFLLYWGIVGFVHLSLYHRRLAEESSRRAQLEHQFAVAQLSALRAQVQPHFLFNTLNSIAELLHTDADAAERMTTALADLLRETLDSGDREEITLKEELEMLDRYLSIQAVRFSDSITIERMIDGAALPGLVPPLLLQPLVENAFRHGLARKRQEGRISIVARREGERLHLEIGDNGTGVPAEIHEGIGLHNTKARLEQLHGSAQTMTLREASGGGALATITLPYREETV